MTTVAEKIIQTRKKINSGPENVVFARLDALNAVRLSTEALGINGLANGLSSIVQDAAGGNSGQTLIQVVENQSKIEAACKGFPSTNIESFATFSSGTIYNFNDVNFTFPTSTDSETKFCIQVLSPDGENVINLSSNTSETQTITNDDGTTNTFSTYFGNYYFVQSRATGSLVKTTDTSDLNAILLPNVEKPLGANTPFGVAGEENTWNQHYAVMNFGSFSFDANNGMRFVTTERPLRDGLSNTFSSPSLYDPLILKRKMSDGGESEHTQAFVAIIVCEGLLINTSWLPVGDNAGNYSAAEASTTKAVLALQDQSFETRLDFFHNTNMSGNTNPIIKTLANNLNSTSQEIPQFSDSYPNKEALPLKPFVTKKQELQPTGLGERDLFCGRYVHIEKDRQDTSGNADQEFRFVNDTAAKYFYMTSPHNTLNSSGSISQHSLPSFTDPPVLSVSNMTSVVQTLTGFTRDTTNYPLEVAKNLFTSSAAAVHTIADSATAYLSTSIPTSGSNNVTGQNATASLYLTTDGQITSATNQTVISGPTADITHYYYIVDTRDVSSGGTNKTGSYDIFYRKFTVTYSYSTTSGSPGSSTLSRSVTENAVEKAPFMYNDLNAWLRGDAGNTLNFRYNDLNVLKSTFDPHFESLYDGTTSNTTHVIDSTAQSNYEDFYDKISDLDSKKNTWITNHNNYSNSTCSSSGTNASDNSLNYESSIYNSDFVNFKSSASDFETRRAERITTIRSRIGTPTYANSAIAPQDDSGTIYAYQVTTIPTVAVAVSNPTVDKIGITPYGRKVFDLVNSMVDFDTGFLRDAFEKVNSIQFAFDQIKQDRNVYEVLNRRSKQF